MDFTKFNIIANYNTQRTDLFPSTTAAVEQLEEVFNIKVDQDYKEYVTRYGCGILGGTYVRVYLPETIEALYPEWKERITQYWFWDEGKAVLTKEQVLESVIMGDTFDGDEIILYNHQYYILPRHEEMIYHTGHTLGGTIDWLCTAGILTEAFAERDFEPFDPAEYLK
ncbi:hypothetical protein CLV59_108270 [Chitinophaga dinghuensis]|uniref:SUKH superfamily protein n=1 Tax=Chitinophaga dinghuensis TaxID=1539050 RepID=A0A327VRQ0_9BACT|nr:SMI1/KNR4 family protein [Chitinophaga dinghuensis]RAJ76749.1 hypothetical protein CLV59_108270 [Chitinophaga dinghuensis]